MVRRSLRFLDQLRLSKILIGMGHVSGTGGLVSPWTTNFINTLQLRSANGRFKAYISQSMTAKEYTSQDALYGFSCATSVLKPNSGEMRNISLMKTQPQTHTWGHVPQGTRHASEIVGPVWILNLGAQLCGQGEVKQLDVTTLKRNTNCQTTK